MLTLVRARRIQNAKVQRAHQEILCIPVWIITFQSSFFYGKELSAFAQPQAVGTPKSRFPETVYSIYLQLPSSCTEISAYTSSSSMSLQTNLVQGLSFSGFQNLVYRQLIGLLGRVIGPSQGPSLQRIAQTQKEHRHASTPWVEFEPRSQCSGGRRQYTPYTARPL
jgi:hypothetical protein